MSIYSMKNMLTFFYCYLFREKTPLVLHVGNELSDKVVEVLAALIFHSVPTIDIKHLPDIFFSSLKGFGRIWSIQTIGNYAEILFL